MPKIINAKINCQTLKQISEQVDWRQALEKVQAREIVEQIRLNTHTRRPLAGDSFISKVEKLLNKRLRPLPIGRPKKSEAKS